MGIYVHNKISTCLIGTSSTIEQLWLSLALGSFKFIVACLYRAPKIDYKMFFPSLKTHWHNAFRLAIISIVVAI